METLLRTRVASALGTALMRVRRIVLETPNLGGHGGYQALLEELSHLIPFRQSERCNCVAMFDCIEEAAIGDR